MKNKPRKRKERMLVNHLSLADVADLKYRELNQKFAKLGRGNVTPELFKDFVRATVTYNKNIKRKNCSYIRKVNLYTRFISLLNKLDRDIEKIPQSSGASCGDTSAIGAPSIQQTPP